MIEDLEPATPGHSGAEGVGVDAQGHIYGAIVRRQMLERHVKKQLEGLTVKKQTRRKFLRAASVTAAAIGLPLSGHLGAAATEGQVFLSEPFQLVTAERIKTALMALDAKPGNNNILGAKILPFTMALTVEKNKVDKEFEYHEDRDHLFQILDGTTTYEVGGTPQGGHSEQPGQWHSPTSAGASTITLNKGDLLLIPRGMPHKRITQNSVTFMLVSATSPLKT